VISEFFLSLYFSEQTTIQEDKVLKVIMEHVELAVAYIPYSRLEGDIYEKIIDEDAALNDTDLAIARKYGIIQDDQINYQIPIKMIFKNNYTSIVFDSLQNYPFLSELRADLKSAGLLPPGVPAEESLTKFELVGGPEIDANIPQVALRADDTCEFLFEGGTTCVTSANYPNSYEVPDRCELTVLFTAALKANPSFYVDGYDNLNFDGRNYTKTNRPRDGIQVFAGERIFWNSYLPTVKEEIVEIVEEINWLLIVAVALVLWIVMIPLTLLFGILFKHRLERAEDRLMENMVKLDFLRDGPDIDLMECCYDPHYFLYGICFLGIRASHTYHMLKLDPFWMTYGLWLFPPFAMCRAIRNRIKLQEMEHLNVYEFDFTKPDTWRRIFLAAFLIFFCTPCTIIQEARIVDKASGVKVKFPALFYSFEDDTDLLRDPIRVIDISSLGNPRVHVVQPKNLKKVDKTPVKRAFSFRTVSSNASEASDTESKTSKATRPTTAASTMSKEESMSLRDKMRRTDAYTSRFRPPNLKTHFQGEYKYDETCISPGSQIISSRDMRAEKSEQDYYEDNSNSPRSPTSFSSGTPTMPGSPLSDTKSGRSTRKTSRSASKNAAIKLIKKLNLGASLQSSETPTNSTRNNTSRDNTSRNTNKSPGSGLASKVAALRAAEKMKLNRKKEKPMYTIDVAPTEEEKKREATDKDFRTERLLKIFKEVDQDKSGAINYREFKDFLQRYYGVEVNHIVMQNILQEVDRDANGLIDKDEFLEFFEEMEKIQQVAASDLKGTKKKRFLKQVGSFYISINALFLFLSLMLVANFCSQTCKPNQDNKQSVCIGRSRWYCTMQCMAIRSITEYMKYKLYLHIVAMITGFIFVIIFAVYVFVPALYALIFPTRGSKDNYLDTEPLENHWPQHKLENDDEDIIPATKENPRYKPEAYAAAEQMFALMDQTNQDHGYFNPMVEPKSRAIKDTMHTSYEVNPQEGWTGIHLKEKTTDYNVPWTQTQAAPPGPLALTDGTDRATDGNVRDAALALQTVKSEEEQREQMVQEKEEWENWMDQFNRIDHYKRCKNATPGPDLAHALANARRVNATGLEEFEEKQAEWERGLEEFKQLKEMHAFTLKQALHSECVIRIRAALENCTSMVTSRIYSQVQTKLNEMEQQKTLREEQERREVAKGHRQHQTHRTRRLNSVSEGESDAPLVPNKTI